MGKKFNVKNKEYQLLDRRRQVAELYLYGKSQWEICRELKICQGTVSNDLAAIRKEWLHLMLRDFDARKSEELAKLDRIEAQAWDSFHLSKENAEFNRKRMEEAIVTLEEKVEVRGKRKSKQVQKLVPVKKIEETTSTGRDGDPRWMELVFKCVETRLKIMGLFKDQTTNVTNQMVIKWDDLYGRPAEPNPVEAQILEAEGQVTIASLDARDKARALEVKPTTNGDGHGHGHSETGGVGEDGVQEQNGMDHRLQ